MIVAAGFAINIPIAVRDIVGFIVDEIFPAIGTLFQMFIPAIVAEMKFPVSAELFRRPADVTFHDNLHWLVCTTTRRHFAEERVALLKFHSSSLPQNVAGRFIHTFRGKKVNDFRV